MIRKPNVKLNIKIILTVFIILFAVLAGFLIYSMSEYGESWFATPYNPRINEAKKSIVAGTIYDRTGTVLAQSSGTERIYNSDEKTRRAVSHVVGDVSGMTQGAETVFAKYIYGFDTGLIDKVSNVIYGNDGSRGMDIALTVDAALCRYIYTNNDYNCGIAVMNYKTGEVLASVSIPTFDPEDLSRGSSESKFVDRVIQGRYPPGSTFKIITAAAATEAGCDIEYTCSDKDILDGQKITCVKSHGTQSLREAFANSCNTYFANLAQSIGASAVQKWAEMALYNTEFNFRDFSPARSQFETSFSAGDNAWAAIGQYTDLVTPMHNCMIAAAVANGGKMVEPRFLKKVAGTDVNGIPNVIASLPSRECSIVKEYMRAAVESGTATNAQIKGYSVCGKTGTAEYTEDGKTKNHSWFVGFIDDDNHPLAISVILEGAGYGSAHATPLAHDILCYAIERGY